MQPESRPESQPESLEAKLLTLLAGGSMAKAELSKNLGQKGVSGQLNKVVRRLLAKRMIEYTLPDKPRSRLQQYRLTDRGEPWRKLWRGGTQSREHGRRTVERDMLAGWLKATETQRLSPSGEERVHA